MSGTYRIEKGDLGDAEVRALLQLHLDEMHQWSPPESVHAMPAERLAHPDVTFFAAWDGDVLAAVGAIKELDRNRGELKSMRASPAYRGKGAGKALLHHLFDVARERGYRWIGLETGTPEAFQPARQLYLSHGFAQCEPFGDYVADDFSVCMEMELA